MYYPFPLPTLQYLYSAFSFSLWFSMQWRRRINGGCKDWTEKRALHQSFVWCNSFSWPHGWASSDSMSFFLDCEPLWNTVVVGIFFFTNINHFENYLVGKGINTNTVCYFDTSFKKTFKKERFRWRCCWYSQKMDYTKPDITFTAMCFLGISHNPLKTEH